MECTEFAVEDWRVVSENRRIDVASLGSLGILCGDLVRPHTPVKVVDPLNRLHIREGLFTFIYDGLSLVSIARLEIFDCPCLVNILKLRLVHTY